jgi:hypothetical protein
MLSVAGDATVGAGGSGGPKVRHVNGKHFQNDNNDVLYLNWDTGHAVQIGGPVNASLVVTGSVGQRLDRKYRGAPPGNRGEYRDRGP